MRLGLSIQMNPSGGVVCLDPSIAEPDVVDWSEDWSNYESLPCAENVQ